MRSLVLLAVSLAFLSPAVATAQQGGSFIVHQLQVCPPENQAALNRFTDQSIAPIMNALKAEGMIRSWSHFVHAWGDEWNNVFVTETESHQAFLTFFTEFLRRLNTAAPNWQTEFLPLCPMHKDNFYTVRNGG